MAHQTQNIARTGIALPGRDTCRSGFWGWLLAADCSHRHRAALTRLTDAQLRDVGLTRAQIDGQAGKSVWNAPDFWLK